MPVTDQDARALAYLAGRLRDETPEAKRWDSRGIEAITTKLIGKGLASTIERVSRHAADPKALTPGAMLRPFIPDGERDADRRPMPPKPGQECRLCGHHVERCTCDEPTTKPAAKSEYAEDHIKALRKALLGAQPERDIRALTARPEET